MSILTLSPAQLRQAADLQEKIAGLEKQLSQLLGTKASSDTAAKPVALRRRGMSAAGRARVAAGQKARWAKVNAAKAKASVKVAAKPAKKKFTMSAEAKAKISVAAKARWAAKKAAKK